MTDRKRILELLEANTCNAICNFCEHFKSASACERYKRERLADYLIVNGVTFAADNNVGHKKTNADKIKAMNDEELTKYLLSISTAECPFDWDCKASTCLECWNNWLKQPVED